MYNTDFTTVFSESDEEFVGHKVLEYGQTKDGFGLFAKATSSLSAGVIYILPTGVLTSIETEGAIKSYLETALTGTSTAPQYIFCRTFGKNSVGDFIVPTIVVGSGS
jgi:hypothetical protein